jgi:hypothetical protein
MTASRAFLPTRSTSAFVVRQGRTKQGTATSRELRPGAHRPAVSPEEFNRVQSILRARYKAPGRCPASCVLTLCLLRCATCGEKVWCQHIKSLNYYRESSASRGIACVRAGRYWPAPAVDHQIDGLVKPLELPVSRQERAFELANADSSLSTACEPRHRPKRPSSSCPSMISGASARTGNWPLPRRSTKC